MATKRHRVGGGNGRKKPWLTQERLNHVSSETAKVLFGAPNGDRTLSRRAAEPLEAAGVEDAVAIHVAHIGIGMAMGVVLVGAGFAVKRLVTGGGT
jgi:hypothetical protein